jgi:hypothetical protein
MSSRQPKRVSYASGACWLSRYRGAEADELEKDVGSMAETGAPDWYDDEEPAGKDGGAFAFILDELAKI